MIPGALPGLAAEALQGTPGHDREMTRVNLGSALASRLLGHLVDLERGKERWELVDQETRDPIVQLRGQLVQVSRAGGHLVKRIGGERAGRYAALLLRAACPDNHLAGVLCHKDPGKQSEEYLGGLALWKSSLRIDPNWMTTMRTRSRQKARICIKSMERNLPKAERELQYVKQSDGKLSSRRLTPKLLTLTQPRRPGARTLDQLQVLNMATEALRKTKLWERTIWGAVKGVEDKLEAKGPHVHAHVLTLSRFIVRHAWQRAWWFALNFAMKKVYGEGMEYMPGGLPVIDVRQVKKKMPAGRELAGVCSMAHALDEVSKYITKTSDLLKPDKSGKVVTPETLLELCEIRRWPRMFELLGACRNQAPQAFRTFVHTSCISVAESFRDVLTQAREMEEGPAPEPSPIERSWEREYSYRKVTREDGTIVMEREDPGDREALHWQWDHGRGTYQARQRTRPATWRELMDQLNFSDWLHLMMGRAEAGQKFRLKQIADKNPTCMLVDLNGRCVLKQQPED